MQLLTPPADSFKRRSNTLVIGNISICSRRTSVRLEPEMWDAIAEICRREGKSINEICSFIKEHKASGTSMTSAIRVFIVAYFRQSSTEDGHTNGGHGQGFLTMDGVVAVQGRAEKTSSLRDGFTNEDGGIERK